MENEKLIIAKEKDFVVCLKKPGMLAEKSGNAYSLPLEAEKALVQIGEKSELYTVHRLDRQVGGLTLLARNKAAASHFAKEISERRVDKRYLAVLIGEPPEKEATLKDILFRDASKNKTFVVDRERKGTRDASLEYRTIASITEGERRLTLVDIKLHTGRTHQIRVQFASRKLPLFGDGRYGSGDKKDIPALFAYSLSFYKRNGKIATYTVHPTNYPFSLFEDYIKNEF